jgi:hypothetical protein
MANALKRSENQVEAGRMPLSSEFRDRGRDDLSGSLAGFVSQEETRIKLQFLETR